MAKKELNFGKLGLPQKATIIKKEEPTPNIEQAIERIHGDAQKGRVVPIIETAPVVAVEEQKVELATSPPATKGSTPKTTAKAKVVEAIELDEIMPVKKISMDLPLDVYKYLKINSFEKAITMKDYVLRLIEAEMRKSK